MTAAPLPSQRHKALLRPCAFLFDSAAEGMPNPALPFFSAAVLGALSAADPDGATQSQFRNGLSSLADFAALTTAVHAADRSTGRTVSYDMDTYK